MRPVLHALSVTGSMTWEITWPLILGFAHLPDQGVSWDYTTGLNIVFLILAAVLVTRFVRTGGLPMLRMMGGAPEAD